MKRILVVLSIATALTVGIGAAAYAYGPGRGGFGPGMMGGYGGGHGPGMMGGYNGGYGPGMMGGYGGGYGPGMMGRGGAFGSGYCAGANYDPAAMATMAETMVTQQKSVLTNLQAQLAAATKDDEKAWLTTRIEWQTIQVNWAEGRVAVVKALPADNRLQSEVNLAQYDVDFFNEATATDSGNQAFIASRLSAAKERLGYWQAELAKAQANQQ